MAAARWRRGLYDTRGAHAASAVRASLLRRARCDCLIQSLRCTSAVASRTLPFCRGACAVAVHGSVLRSTRCRRFRVRRRRRGGGACAYGPLTGVCCSLLLAEHWTCTIRTYARCAAR